MFFFFDFHAWLSMEVIEWYIQEHAGRWEIHIKVIIKLCQCVFL